MPTLSPDGFKEQVEDNLRDHDEFGPNVIQVDLSPSFERIVEINLLKISDPANRGKKIGSRVLRLLMQLADESDIVLEVIPHSFDGPMSDAQLAAWYGRHGFKLVVGSPESRNLMRRESRR